MPTLPLYTPNDVADASHRVIAPGGYEWWHFDAESDAGELRLVVTLGIGPSFDAEYHRRYLRYLRRPTRHPPPVPSDYPFARAAIYEREHLVADFTAVCAADQFAASDSGPAVRVGDNDFTRTPDGTLSLRLRASPLLPSALLTFRPLLPYRPYEAKSLSHVPPQAEHHWVVADPLCEVTGTLQVQTAGATPRTIDFRGRGYHDHRYGTGPLAAGPYWRLTGRLFMPESAYALQLLRPPGKGIPQDIQLVHVSAEGPEQVTGDGFKVDWCGSTRSHMPYPNELAWGTRLRLAEPRVVESSHSHVRLVYRAWAHGQEETGTAFCEVGNDHRGRRLGKVMGALPAQTDRSAHQIS